jgi:hypothetical protein
MKRVAGLLLAGLLLLMATPGAAWAGGHRGRGSWGYHRGGSVGIWFGPGPWWGPRWGPPLAYYPYPYAYSYPYSYPYPYGVPYRDPVVVDPPVYVERPAAERSSPEGPSEWWYYCTSRKGYYPNVRKCPEAWVKVAPRPE